MTSAAAPDAWLRAPGPSPCGLCFDGEALWCADAEAERLYRIDPASGAVERSVELPGITAGTAWHAGALYQVAGNPQRLVRCDPSGAARPLWDLGDDVCDIAVAGGVVYLLRCRAGMLEAVERFAGRTLAAWPAPAGTLAFDLLAGAVVYLTPGAIAMGDPGQTIPPAHLAVARQATAVAVGNGKLFVSDAATGQIQVHSGMGARRYPAMDLPGLTRVGAPNGAAVEAEVQEVLKDALFEPTLQDLNECMASYRLCGLALLMLVESGRVAGVVGIDARSPGLVEVRHLAVARPLRGRGVGRRIMNIVQRAVAPRTVWLSTDQDAVDFYRRIGMRVESVGEPYPGRERFVAVGREAMGK